MLFSLTLFGQSIDMNQLVSLHYRNVRLGDALQNISTQYNVYFSYSKHYVPIEQRVNIKVVNAPLTTALDELFLPTEVVYVNIGDQIVLRRGKKAQPLEESFGMIRPPLRAIEQEEVLTASTRPYEDIKEVPILADYNNFGLPEVFSETPEKEIDTERYYVEAPKPDSDHTTAQISIVPDFGTNMEKAKARTNNFSLNVLGGENGGVNGVEVGGLFNKVRNDVKGVQIAGVFNAVGGDVGPPDLFDEELKDAMGVQVAGLVNVATNTKAVQFAGLLNVNRGNYEGVQFGGLGSVNNGYGKGIQFAGLFNINRGDGAVQFAGVTNIANDVEGLQVSGLFNRAKRVRGSQLSLINVCDTISGASIGVLNFVRKGYNQVELGGSETMYAQGALRFGSLRFYNILQFGVQLEEARSYGFGYGIGTTVRRGHFGRWQHNWELVVSKIVEDGVRFKDLNMLGELRLTWEWKMSKYTSLYLGPTANLMFSEVKNIESTPVAFNSDLPLYTLLENENDNRLNLKAWFGFRAGFRFGRN